MVLAGGGITAWLVMGHKAHPHTGGQLSASHRSSAGTQSTQPATGTTPTAQPTTATPPVTGVAATYRVRIGPSVAQSATAQQVATFLGSYFRSINSHNYPLYASLFQPSDVLTRAQFRRGYRSSRDSDATLIRLWNAPSGLAAAITFTSRQNPADSATGTACTDWTVRFYLTPAGAGYLIGKPPATYHARYRAC